MKFQCMIFEVINSTQVVAGKRPTGSCSLSRSGFSIIDPHNDPLPLTRFYLSGVNNWEDHDEDENSLSSTFVF